jgi:hypothetical protein
MLCEEKKRFGRAQSVVVVRGRAFPLGGESSKEYTKDSLCVAHGPDSEQTNEEENRVIGH